MSRSYCLFYHNKNFFSLHFSNFSQIDNTLLYNQHNAIYRLQQRTTVVLGLWSWFSSFERKDLDENLTISSLEIPLAAWSLLLSQRQEFSDNQLPRVLITPYQQGTFETKEEVHSIVGAQDTDTRGYKLSDLEDIEFSWEDPAVDMDSVHRTWIDTPFSQPSFDVFQMGSTAANSIITDDEEYKENSAPTTTTTVTPESERPTEPPRLLRSRPSGID